MEGILVIERTLREKTIRSDTDVLSRTLTQLGPTLVREAEPGETECPAEDIGPKERRDIGYWKRLVGAVRALGLPD